jgi:hypothetical protein
MTAEKVRENRLRRMAERQGLWIHKSARRDPRAIDFGLWALDNGVPPRPDYRYTIDEIEKLLKGETP